MHTTITRITLTGADERTPLKRIEQLAAMPYVEVGLLLTATPEGRNRYPSPAWLREATIAAAGKAALHVCGSTARQWLRAGKIPDLVDRVGRLQVNGRVGQAGISVADVEALCRRYTDKIIITQHCPGNEDLLQVASGNHALLVDASAGRGLAPAAWCRPPTAKTVGFAGGLGPKTLANQLPPIAAAAAGQVSWVDMEGAIRTADDWFDPDRAETCVALFAAWREAAPAA